MSIPTFADTHNLVAFLEKPEESNGFEEIIDFLNASSIQYALTVNPTIYTTCIKQFWTSAKAMTVNGERHIQALVDKKKVIITESSIRNDLKLDDAEGIDCLPTATIFKELERMGAKTAAWNEYSITMASAIIYLATYQNFNFLIFLDNQVEGMSRHKWIYVIPFHTKKVFANMKRPGKGFSKRVTSLFSTMMVQASEDMGEDSAAPTDSHSTHIITQPSSSKLQKKKSRRKQRKDNGPIEPVTNMATNEAHEKVLDLEKARTAQAKDIASLKKRVKQLEKRRKSRTLRLKRLSKGRKIADLDAHAEVTLINETQERNDDDFMFDTDILDDDKVFEEPMVSAATTTRSIPVTIAASVVIPDELTLAQNLMEIKSIKPKAVTTYATTVTPVFTRPKAKGILFHDQDEQAPESKPIISPA
ncbi:hypothetical protein Tco_1304501 [Tanacetum coccineum]